MKIELKCELIGRLSKVNRNLPANESRDWLRSVFIERFDGHVFVGATNAQFASIEFAGIQRGDDGFVVIRHDGVWLDAAANSDPDCVCEIEDWPAMNFATLSAPNGYRTTSDAAIRNVEAILTLKSWRNWLPQRDEIASGHPMFLDVDQMENLVDSSPSGAVVFPKYINSHNPVIVRDVVSPNWIGVFFAQTANGYFNQGATLPDWVKK